MRKLRIGDNGLSLITSKWQSQDSNLGLSAAEAFFSALLTLHDKGPCVAEVLRSTDLPRVGNRSPCQRKPVFFGNQSCLQGSLEGSLTICGFQEDWFLMSKPLLFRARQGPPEELLTWWALRIQDSWRTTWGPHTTTERPPSPWDCKHCNNSVGTHTTKLLDTRSQCWMGAPRASQPGWQGPWEAAAWLYLPEGPMWLRLDTV